MFTYFHGKWSNLTSIFFFDWVAQPPTGAFLALLFVCCSNSFGCAVPRRWNSRLAPESHDENGTRHPLSFLVFVGLLFRGTNRIKKHGTSLVNGELMGWNLLLNAVYWGCEPTDPKLLRTSWDIQLSLGFCPAEPRDANPPTFHEILVD